jgi:hypothetical protein
VHTYGHEEAFEVIRLSQQDYVEKFTELGEVIKITFPE